MKKILFRLLLLAGLTVAGGLWGLKWYTDHSVVNGGEVDIFPGASARQVADLLEANGVIESSDAFYYYIRLKESYYEYIEKQPYRFKVNFKQGTFKVTANDFDEVIAQLNKGMTEKAKKTNGLVTIPEGLSVVDIASILEKNRVINSKAFLDYIQSPETYQLLKARYIWLPDYQSERKYPLEGFLHANSYQLTEGMLPGDVISVLLKETDAWYEKNKVRITESGYTFDQLITLASVVERESKFEKDRPKVAQVFYNRLQKNMKLESDITAAYGNGEHKVFMYYKDIKKSSPYNTYLVPGLPVGPICSPSTNAFNAVLNPEGPAFTSLYFYARPSGETFYANTFAEHDKNRLLYEHEWKALTP